MLNYIKSEKYRILHSKDVYVMTMICCGLIILMNVVLALSEKNIQDFPYATTRFSFNMLIAQVRLVLVVAFIMASLVFGDEFKHRTLKNTISFGISRNQIFSGKYVISLVVSLLCFFIIMICYIGSAYLLLENSGNEVFRELFLALVATIPGAIASLTLGMALFFFIDSGINASLLWAGIVIFIPTILELMGGKIKICYQIGNWLPWTMLSRVTANQSTYLCIWDTAAGMIRCVVVGVIGTVVFFLLGVKAFYRKDIK